MSNDSYSPYSSESDYEDDLPMDSIPDEELEKKMADVSKTKHYAWPLPILNHKNLPTVYPTISVVNFYNQVLNSPKLDKNADERRIKGIENITYEQMQERIACTRLSAIVGPPGSGKTFLSTKLIMTGGKTWFFLKGTELNYETLRLSLKNLLVSYLNPHIKPELWDPLFEWICKNQDRCVIVIDGLERAPFSLSDANPVHANYDTKLLIQEIIGNLFYGKFLPDAHVCFTSRPNTIVFFQDKMRPEEVFYLSGYSPEDMKQMCLAYAGESAKSILTTFEGQSQIHHELYSSPAMLQLMLISILETEEYKDRQSITKMITFLYEGLRRSEFTCRYDINDLKDKVSKLAFQATKKSTVVVTAEELENEEVSFKDVQDYIMTVPSYSGFSQKLLETDRVSIFPHELLQLYYTAYHISENMDEREFNDIVKEIVSERRWAMVRRFLCGFLLADFQPPTQIKAKLQKFFSKFKFRRQKLQGKALTFYRHMLKAFKEGQYSLDMIVDLQETNDAVVESFAKYFPHKADFSRQLIGPSRIHALSQILHHKRNPIRLLRLTCSSVSCELVKNNLGGFTKKLVMNLLEIPPSVHECDQIEDLGKDGHDRKVATYKHSFK